MDDHAPLGSLAEINPRSPSARIGELISFVSMADVSERGYLENVRVRPASPGYTAFVDGDVLLAKITPCMENGKGAHIRGLLISQGQGSTEFHVLRARPGTSDRFLYHLTRTESFRLRAEALMTGSAGQRRVPTEFFSKYVVRVPPLDEQQRIAEILDTIDETIQATERVIAKLELVRLGLRERFCTPGGSSLGPAPISTMVESVVDCPHSTPEYLDSGVLVARTMHIKNGRFLTESASRVSEASYQDRIARMAPATGDVVLTREAPVGEAFAIPDRMRICLGQRVVLIRPGAELLGQYLVELIYSDQGQRQIRRLSAGTTNPHLNVDDIRDLAFDVPGPEVQRAALTTLAAATSEIDAEQAKLLKLKQTRSGLAADLLSGRVRTVAA